MSAALNIGRVIAERCLQAGLNRVSMYTTDIRKKEKVNKRCIYLITPLKFKFGIVAIPQNTCYDKYTDQAPGAYQTVCHDSQCDVNEVPPNQILLPYLLVLAEEALGLESCLLTS